MLTRQQKEDIISELTSAFRGQGALLFLDYQGVSARKMVELRQSVRDAGGTLRVIRKTLLKRAMAGAELPELAEETFEGQTGVVYGFTDPVAVAKVLANFRKALIQEKGDEVVFAIRGAILDGKALAPSEASALATIPSRDELLARAVGSIISPIRGLLGVLSGPQRKLVYALNAIKESK